MSRSLDRQEGGQHYISCPIQPWEYIAANRLDFFEGNIIKYVTRWRKKGGVQDLLKAKHYLEFLIEREVEREKGFDYPQHTDELPYP